MSSRPDVNYRLKMPGLPKVDQMALKKVKARRRAPLPEGYVPGEATDEWREWHQKGTVGPGVRQQDPLSRPNIASPMTGGTATRDFESCNKLLQQSMAEEADPAEVQKTDLLNRIKSLRFLLSDAFRRLTDREKILYSHELLRPGGLFLAATDSIPVVETAMPAHIVAPDGSVPPPSNEWKRDLMQIADELVRLATQLCTLCGGAQQEIGNGEEEVEDEEDEAALSWPSRYRKVTQEVGAALRDAVAEALEIAAKGGDLDYVQWWTAGRSAAEFFNASIPNRLSETMVVSALHIAILHRHERVVEYMIQSNAEQAPETAVTFDGTAMHLAAWSGNPIMVHILLKAGVDVNVSSSPNDVQNYTDFKQARPLIPVSVADVPWKYQQKTQEFTPLDIFEDFCQFKGSEKEYAGLSQCKLLLEGHGGLRHGVLHLAHSMVFYTASGGQMAVDSEEGKRRRQEAMEGV